VEEQKRHLRFSPTIINRQRNHRRFLILSQFSLSGRSQNPAISFDFPNVIPRKPVEASSNGIQTEENSLRCFVWGRDRAGR
jgi:hypothetical protein